MAGAGSGDLFDCAFELLEACALALVDTPAGGPPGSVFLSPGPPPWDCEQLSVYVGGPVVADTLPLQPVLAPGHRAVVQGFVNLITMTATVLRCIPVLSDDGEFPSADALTLATQQTAADCWAIVNHLNRRKRDGTLFAPREREFYVDPTVALNQAGGFGGWQIQVRVQLDGYKPAP